MSESFDFGKKGEEIAEDFLKKKGYTILEKNWRSGKHEVDIIALDGKLLVVVEVKSRTSLYAGEPELAVNRDKQRGMIIVANAYLKYKKMDNEVRFDIVSILIMKETERISHLVDAFYPY